MEYGSIVILFFEHSLAKKCLRWRIHLKSSKDITITHILLYLISEKNKIKGNDDHVRKYNQYSQLNIYTVTSYNTKSLTSVRPPPPHREPTRGDVQNSS